MSKAKKPKVSEKPTILVYCGPTIPHVCTRYSMFSKIPDTLNEKVKEVPLIKTLIVPISQFKNARLQIEGMSGYLYTIYREIQNLI